MALTRIKTDQVLDGTITNDDLASNIALNTSGSITTSSDISAANATLTGYLRGPSSFTIDPATHGDDTGTVIIAGNLQIDGTTTTINSSTLTVDDKNVVLASGAANAAAADGAGIQVDISGVTNPELAWYAGAVDTGVPGWEFNYPVVITQSGSGRTTNLHLVNETSEAATEIALEMSVVGPSNDACDVRLVAKRDGANAGSDFYIEVTNSSSTITKPFYIKETGNVGIGTDSPSGRFHVVGAGGLTGGTPQNSGSSNQIVIENNASSGSADIQMLGPTNGYNHIFFGDADDANIGVIYYNHNNNSLNFTTNANGGKMTITSGGNVGIGTDNPQTVLHIDSSNPEIRFQPASDTDTSRIRFRNAADDSSRGQIAYDHTNQKLIFNVLGDRVWITNTGDVGIGTDAPESKLAIKGSSGDNDLFSISDITVPTSGAEYGVAMIKTNSTEFALNITGYNAASKGLRLYTNGASSERTALQVLDAAGTNFIVDGVGNVGIGTSNPQAKLDVEGEIQSTQLNLDAIENSSITDTAVDIFIYDTRKDSDGGAWRKRTQHTSWYNETLNTAFRGSRREFPVVAIIVFENAEINIYDGDDPDLPLWMRWNSANLFSDRPRSLRMLNGLLVASTDHTSAGFAQKNLITANFITEEIGRSSFATAYGGTFRGGLVHRESLDNQGDWEGPNPYTIASFDNMNTVAMTALPNAPIDPATLLPIPTIAVASEGGVTVIKDDGNVYDLSGSNWPAISYNLDFDDKGILYFSQRAFAAIGCDVKGLKQDYTSMVDGRDFFRSGLDEYPFFQAHGEDGNGWGHSAVNYATGSRDDFDLAHWSYYDPPYGRLVRHQTNHDLWNAYRGDSDLMNYTSYNYNTGWMPGNIKLATMMDTDDTDVTGTELLTNGTLGSATGWSFSGSGEYTITGGQLVDGGTQGYEFYSPYATVEIGKTYVATFQADGSGGTPTIRIVDTSSNVLNNVVVTNGGGLSQYSITFTPTGSQTSVRFEGSGQAWTGYYDNFSIRLAEKDLTKNNNGLQVFGTVTKNPVATGADLVAYGGMNSSDNRIVQSYNSDLNVGTGDYTIIAWIKDSDWSNTNNYIIDRGKVNQSGVGRFYFMVNSSNYLTVKHASGNEIYATAKTVPINEWVCVIVTRRNGSLTFAINGEAINHFGNGDAAASFDAGEVGQVTSVGSYPWASNYEVENIALVRFSITAVTKEQIKKIYEDEKVLFQENAKATLYGTSDTLTALAYDNDTKLLHAGTSAGRSVFKGLRRIDNTTDAVGVAISASNGIVADD